MDNHLQRNAQQWFDCVKAYLKSELDINTYCDQNNLSDQRLIYWMGRYYDQKKDGSFYFPVGMEVRLHKG